MRFYGEKSSQYHLDFINKFNGRDISSAVRSVYTFKNNNDYKNVKKYIKDNNIAVNNYDDTNNVITFNDQIMEFGGELTKGIKTEQEHRKTLEGIASGKYTVDEAIIMTAKDHLKENPKYYTELKKIEKHQEGGVAKTIENGDIVRGEYFPKIYGNFYVLNAGADAAMVVNLLTKEESLKHYGEITLFLKKSTTKQEYKEHIKEEGKIKAEMPKEVILPEAIKDNIPSFSPSTNSDNWRNEYAVGDKVRIRVDYVDKDIYSTDKNIFTIVSFIKDDQEFKVDKKGNNIGGLKRPENPSGKLYKLSNGQNWEGKDLELVRETTNIDAKLVKSSKKKEIFANFDTILKGWVNTNYKNYSLITDKDIVTNTVKDYIESLEMVNNTINLSKEKTILKNIDSYL